MQKLFSLTLAGLMMVGFTSRADALGLLSHYRIAWLGNDAGNAYDNAILAGTRDIADRSRSTVTPFYAGFDPDTQLAQCRQVVASRRYDALVILAASNTAIIPCVRLARQAGIPVAAADLVIGTDQTTVQPQVRGQVAASFTPASRFGDGISAIAPQVCAGLSACNILYLAGVESFPVDQYGIAAIEAAAAANPAIRLIQRREAFYDTALARELTNEALDQHPEINVVIASGDQMALGAEQAAQDHGTFLRLVGAGAGASAITAVRAGRWFGTFNVLPRSEGEIATGLLIRALRNPLFFEPRGVDPVEAAELPAFWTEATLAAHPDFVPQWPGP